MMKYHDTELLVLVVKHLKVQSEDTGVTISLDAPIGDATVGVDNSGDVTVSGTWSGVTIAILQSW